MKSSSKTPGICTILNIVGIIFLFVSIPIIWDNLKKITSQEYIDWLTPTILLVSGFILFALSEVIFQLHKLNNQTTETGLEE